MLRFLLKRTITPDIESMGAPFFLGGRRVAYIRVNSMERPLSGRGVAWVMEYEDTVVGAKSSLDIQYGIAAFTVKSSLQMWTV